MVFRAGQPGHLSVPGRTLSLEVAPGDDLPFQVIAARPEAGGYASGPPRRHWFSRPRTDGVRSHRIRAFRRHRVKLARPDTSRWCSVDDIQDTGGRTSRSDSHHGAGATCLLYPQAGQVAAVRNMQYGILAQIHSTDFHEKWILHRAGHEEEFLAAPEASTLTDYGSSYENIEAMQPFPFDKGAFVSLALAVAVPLIPAVLAQIPLAVVLQDLLKAAR